jgi:hypothetical protein
MAHARRSILPWLLAAGCAAATAAPADQLRHLAKGMTSGSTHGNEFMVFHTATDFGEALSQTLSRTSSKGSGNILASVDFDSEIVIGVMLSNRPTGCAGVDITSIAQDGIVSVVHYRERKPRKGEGCQGTLYSPFDFVAIAKSNAPVRFTQDVEP